MLERKFWDDGSEHFGAKCLRSRRRKCQSEHFETSLGSEMSESERFAHLKDLARGRNERERTVRSSQEARSGARAKSSLVRSAQFGERKCGSEKFEIQEAKMSERKV